MKTKITFINCTIIAVILLLFTACSMTSKQAEKDPAEEAKLLIADGKPEDALTFLESAMLDDPTRLELSNMYRQESVKLKRHEESINYFKEQTAKNNPVNEMFYNLAFAYIDKIPTVGPMGSGFLSKRAIAQFQLVLDREPDDWVATYGIGMNYLHWPDYFKKNDSASKFLEESLALQKQDQIKPYYILTYIRLGDAYAKTGEIDKAYQVWEEGLQNYPDHKDLLDRTQTSKDRIGQAMLDLYNPNNSIGEINTDISVLWEPEIPNDLVPLKKNSLKQGGVGGLITGSKAKLGEEKIGLFSWFMRNLPFLSDKNNSANVDMTLLGIENDAANRGLASVVANGMIMGFLSQFEEETPQQARTKADDLSAYDRPFFHEGLGMGYAATTSLDNVAELKNLINVLNKIDPNYTRLHLAGAGMWYGLEASPDLEKVKKAFQYLGSFGEAYAYEGYGFAQTLFYYKRNPELLNIGVQLPTESAKSFYHGAGRALWILSGTELSEFTKRLSTLPEQYQADAYSGYGMGIAFTKAEEPELVFSFLNESDLETDHNIEQLLTGVSMGYVIRNIGSSDYVDKILNASSSANQCRITNTIKIAEDALTKVSKDSGDLHSDWRKAIFNELIDSNSAQQWRDCA